MIIVNKEKVGLHQHSAEDVEEVTVDVQQALPGGLLGLYGFVECMEQSDMALLQSGRRGCLLPAFAVTGVERRVLLQEAGLGIACEVYGAGVLFF